MFDVYNSDNKEDLHKNLKSKLINYTFEKNQFNTL